MIISNAKNWIVSAVQERSFWSFHLVEDLWHPWPLRTCNFCGSGGNIGLRLGFCIAGLEPRQVLQMARIGGSLLEVSPCLPEFLPYLSEKHIKGFACCDAERLMGNGPLCCGRALVWTGWCGVGIVEQLQRGLKGHPFMECITLEQLWLPWQTALKVEIGRNWRGVLSFFGNMPYCGTAVPHHPQNFFPTSPYRQSPPSKRSQDIRDGLGKNSNEGSKDCVSQKCHTFSSATETPKLSSTPQRPYWGHPLSWPCADSKTRICNSCNPSPLQPLSPRGLYVDTFHVLERLPPHGMVHPEIAGTSATTKVPPPPLPPDRRHNHPVKGNRECCPMYTCTVCTVCTVM